MKKFGCCIVELTLLGPSCLAHAKEMLDLIPNTSKVIHSISILRIFGVTALRRRITQRKKPMLSSLR